MTIPARSPDRSSQEVTMIRSDARQVAVVVDSYSAGNLCRLFSTRGAERFGGPHWTDTASGHPVLADALSWLDCRIAAVQPAGDHELVLARAVDGAVGTGTEPLAFHAGRYTGLAG
jgi:flavin reductase (DIM6/NTAB) family NADH-FMN oxidoreductase RutF